MAENEQAHRNDMDKSIVIQDAKLMKSGQYLGFTIA
jgi:uncharacterized membrane protein